MKIIIPAVVVMACAAMFCSCRKVYTCTCTDGASIKNVRTLDKQSKKDAQEECRALSGPTVNGTTTVTLKCTL